MVITSLAIKVLLSIAVIEGVVIPVKSILREYVALKGEITKLYSVIEVIDSIPEIQKRLFVLEILPAVSTPGKPGKDRDITAVFDVISYDDMKLKVSKYKLNIVQSIVALGLGVGVGVIVVVTDGVGVTVDVTVGVIVGV